MNGRYLFYFLFIWVFIDCNSTLSTRPLPFTFEQAILKEDLPKFIAACGPVATADGLLFKSSNSDSCIVGIIQCVSLYDSSFFKKGSKYSLQVTEKDILDSLKNWVVGNPYAGKGYPIFLVTHITKAK